MLQMGYKKRSTGTIEAANDQPVWEEEFSFSYEDEEVLEATIFAKRVLASDKIVGQCRIDLKSQIPMGGTHFYELMRWDRNVENGRQKVQEKLVGELSVSLEFVGFEEQ